MTIPGPYADVTPATFDWREFAARRAPEELLATAEGRRLVTRLDPLLFALVYFRTALSSAETGNEISINQFHLDAYDWARTWAVAQLPAGNRHAWVAPRNSGKTTLFFKILPCWALAHGHRKYVAAYSDSSSQAEDHLASLKREFDHNALLKLDYPELCSPATRPRTGSAVSDNQSTYVARSGAVFSAKGMDSKTLGAKQGDQRPDLLLFDDVEPDASNYSLYLKEKRLATILNGVFPMNIYAVVCMVGTVTMHGSIMHNVVQELVTGTRADWTADAHITPHHYRALVRDEHGEPRSLWPQLWSTAFLLSIEHTADFALNYANDPSAGDGGYWTDEDIVVGTVGPTTRCALFLDPPVSVSSSSDWCGIAITAMRAPSANGREPGGPVVEVQYLSRVKLTGHALRDHVLTLLNRFPGVRRVVVECNQGGQTWLDIMSGIPVQVELIVASESKEVRAAAALNHYQARRVVHTQPFIEAEAEMKAFPHVAHDDRVDALTHGVRYWLEPNTVRKKPRNTHKRKPVLGSMTEYAG